MRRNFLAYPRINNLDEEEEMDKEELERYAGEDDAEKRGHTVERLEDRIHILGDDVDEDDWE
jgi:hypothetical protein